MPKQAQWDPAKEAHGQQTPGRERGKADVAEDELLRRLADLHRRERQADEVAGGDLDQKLRRVDPVPDADRDGMDIDAGVEADDVLGRPVARGDVGRGVAMAAP